MMGCFDYVILGSGISGMTLAILLGSAGAKVAVIEKANAFGGAMQRFRREGVPLDTGFHFTGGISDCFGDMLDVLGIRSDISAVPVKQSVFFCDSKEKLDIPAGINELEAFLIGRFPEQKAGITAYFEAERRVFEATPLFHLRGAGAFYSGLPDIEEDHITLAEFLDRHGICGKLRGILCAAASCYGTAPSEVSFANHARIHYGLCNDPFRLKDGGNAVVKAFLRRADELGIAAIKGTTVASWGECDEKNRIYSAVLGNGETIEFKNLIFTQHPAEVLRLLPQEKVRPSLRERVAELEDTCGFFTWYALYEGDSDEFSEELCSTLTTPDLDRILSGRYPEERTTGFVLSREVKSDGSACCCVTGFQSAFAEETASWNNSLCGRRGADYADYKRKKSQELEDIICRVHPYLKGKLRTICTSSLLTFRDYLSSTGSAYGVRQKVGQINLFGRLPVRNFYTASQSSILPGAVGSMLTALVLFRELAGEEAYGRLLFETLGNKPV
ncbi:MAG: NAD(P)/FAD-dependent oxidoreductase [Lentisphaerae bacterium]|nr:NAD(P)/FAD-dependent oxidoreductase [Lentisphaerota bacterium]